MVRTPSPSSAGPAGVARALLARLGDALYPVSCGLCLAAVPAGAGICSACRADLPRLAHACGACASPLPAAGICPACARRPPAFDRLHVPWAYAWPLDQLVLAWKHGGSVRAGRVLADLAREAAAGLPEPAPTLVVPVPLHPERLRERGFNQAEQLARVVAATLAVPLESRQVQRIRATASQQALGGAARRRNLRGAFAVAAGARPLSGERVLLVDDVVTTGATLAALAGVLRAAGAERVDGLALARA